MKMIRRRRPEYPSFHPEPAWRPSRRERVALIVAIMVIVAFVVVVSVSVATMGQ